MLWANKLSSQYLVYMLGRGLAGVVKIFLLPLFAYHMPASELGVIGLLWLVLPIFTRISTLGTDVSITLRFFKYTHNEFSNSLYHVILINLVVSVFLFFLFWFFKDFYFSILGISLTVFDLSLVVLILFSSAVNQLYVSILRLKTKALSNVLIILITQVLEVVLTWLFLQHQATYKAYLQGAAVANTLVTLLVFIPIFRNYSVRYFSLSKKLLTSLIRLGLPVIPGTVASTFLASGDRYVLKINHGLDTVGRYLMGYQAAEYLVMSLFLPLQKALTPIAFSKAASNYAETQEYTLRLARVAGFVASAILAFLFLFAQPLILLLGSETYISAIPVFIIASTGLFFYHYSGIIGMLFNIQERTSVNTTIAVGVTFLNLGLNFWLIPKGGIMAAALTTLVSYLVMWAWRLIALREYKHFLQTFVVFTPFVLFSFALLWLDSLQLDTSLYWAIKSISYLIFVLITIILAYRNGAKEVVDKFIRKSA